jgi:short-subunit dehydrogenase
MRNALDFAGRYGSWALVTGAASGIGAAFARELGRRGLSLALVDRDGEGVGRVAAALGSQHGVEVEALTGDLTDHAFLERVAALPGTREVGFAIHCAGAYSLGKFVELPIEPQLAAIDLHCRATARIAHACARSMRERRRGALVLVSSNSALLRAPFVANYAATKAYALALAEALFEELRGDGIDVLGLVPGMTDTPLLSDSRPEARRAARITVTAEHVVAAALDCLGHTPVCIPTFLDRVAASVLGGLVPSRMSRFLVGRSMRYFYPHLPER